MPSALEVFCELLASLLKRCAGRRSSPEALAAMLEGLAGDVTYRAPNNCHTALAGRRPQEQKLCLLRPLVAVWRLFGGGSR